MNRLDLRAWGGGGPGQRFDLHTHTIYSDGENTPEEMILAAIDLGLQAIGISDHSYTSFDESYCMSRGNTAAYKAELKELKEKYRDRIQVLCGIEQDYYADDPPEGFDYVIGSVHYVKCGSEYWPVDEDAQTLLRCAEKHFGGDLIALAEEYYRCVGDVVHRTGADIIGHFDLITKFAEQTGFPNTSDPRYIAAWQAAAKKLEGSGAVFEINTGAMSRGYRTSPYPENNLTFYLEILKFDRIFSSDAHSRDYLCYNFF